MANNKTLLLLVFLFSFSAAAQEGQKQVTCKGKGAITDLWNFSTEADVFRGSGFFRVKIDGLYEKQLLGMRSMSGHRQLQLHLQTGAKEMLVSVSSAEDAKKVWEHVPVADTSATALMSPERLVAEYNKNVEAGAKNVYLALHRDNGADGFSYAGFCKLRGR